MTLVRFDKVSLEFGEQVLFREADFALEPGERVCLIGRNGAGKSTLLRLVTGAQQPDHGNIEYKKGLRISQLEQELPESSDAAVETVVGDGLARLQGLIGRYRELAQCELNERGLKDLQELQQQIEAGGGWQPERQVERVMSELDLPAGHRLDRLSGGWRRRVALGKALVSRPELLLLDEPTNHLDISTIEWLEHEVRAYRGCVLFITHDRAFLQKLATRIVEIDRGRLTSWPGDYRKYLRDKEAMLEEEARNNALFDKKLAQEEAWIRQGVKARRTRNEGRVRALMAMREQRSQRIKQPGQARMHLQEAEQSGRKVVEARNITHGYGGKPLIRDFSLKIMRGDRIGLIGNNGVGKSTLLRILLGELKPDSGSVKFGTNVETAYFDQLRRRLDPEKTVAETVGDGREYITLNGKDRHIVSYLTDFLFTAKRALSPVKVLSGGERNRVILAQLFTRPANLIVLDEPTNDLDVEMLEVLEARLVDYAGTLIVVSHDRDFLDNVVTSTLVFEGDGRIGEYVGGYSDWLRYNRQLAETGTPQTETGVLPEEKAKSPREKTAKPGKLTYKLQRELDALPETIESLENALADYQQRTTSADFQALPYEQMQQVLEEMADVQARLDRTMERWLELESAASG